VRTTSTGFTASAAGRSEAKTVSDPPITSMARDADNNVIAALVLA
jgi:hypothetical protein